MARTGYDIAEAQGLANPNTDIDAQATRGQPDALGAKPNGHNRAEMSTTWLGTTRFMLAVQPLRLHPNFYGETF